MAPADCPFCLIGTGQPSRQSATPVRGAKLRLADVDAALIGEALRPGRRLIARVRLTDATGNPIYARLRPPDIEWGTG